MELEYPFKIALYIFVIIVVVGILITFRSKFMKICFLPPCEEKETCNQKPAKVNEDRLSNNIIDKYHDLCVEKTKECKEDVFCYIISVEQTVNPSSLNPNCVSNGKCEISCNKDTKIVYLTYRWAEGKTEIGC